MEISYGYTWNMQDKQEHALQVLYANSNLQVQNQKHLHHPQTKRDDAKLNTPINYIENR